MHRPHAGDVVERTGCLALGRARAYCSPESPRLDECLADYFPTGADLQEANFLERTSPAVRNYV